MVEEEDDDERSNERRDPDDDDDDAAIEGEKRVLGVWAKIGLGAGRWTGGRAGVGVGVCSDDKVMGDRWAGTEQPPIMRQC